MTDIRHSPNSFTFPAAPRQREQQRRKQAGVMGRSLSEKMLAALKVCETPFNDRDPWDVIECLSIKEGIPYKVAWRRLEKASARGYLDYGTSIKGAWLTPEGRAALDEARSPSS